MDIDILTGPSPRELGGSRFTVFDSAGRTRGRAHCWSRLGEGTADAGLAAPPGRPAGLLPQVESEMPSSIAVATTGAIRPTLTGCGAQLRHGAAHAGLSSMPSEAAVDGPLPSSRHEVPEPADVAARPVVRRGAARCDRGCGLRRRAVRRRPTRAGPHRGTGPAGHRGRLGGARGPQGTCRGWWSRWVACGSGPSDRARTSSSCSGWRRSRPRGRGSTWGSARDRSPLQFHNGGGVPPASWARSTHGGRRRRVLLRAEMSVQKPLHHLAARRGLATQLGSWLARFFAEDCPSIPVDDEDGRRALRATRLAMSYGFAYRLATYAALRSIVRTPLGATTRLVVDSPHNSVYEEDARGDACLRAPAQRLPRLSRGRRTEDHPAFARSRSSRCPRRAPTAPPRPVHPGGNRPAQSLPTACHGTGSIDLRLRGARADPGPNPRAGSRPRIDDAGARPGAAPGRRRRQTRPWYPDRTWPVLPVARDAAVRGARHDRRGADR